MTMRFAPLTASVLAFVVAVSPTLAADKLLFGTMHLQPYAFKTEQGGYAGTLFDITNLILKQMGQSASDNEVLPMKRVHAALAEGQRHCMLSARTDYALTRYDSVADIGQSIDAVVLPRRGIKLTQFGDLAGLSIAVPLGVRLSERFDFNAEINRVSAKDYRTATEMIARGRVDAVAGAYGSYLFNMRRIKMDVTLTDKPFVLGSHGVWVMCTKGLLSMAQKQRVKTAVAELKSGKAIRHAAERYLGTKPSW